MSNLEPGPSNKKVGAKGNSWMVKSLGGAKTPEQNGQSWLMKDDDLESVDLALFNSEPAEVFDTPEQFKLLSLAAVAGVVTKGKSFAQAFQKSKAPPPIKRAVSYHLAKGSIKSKDSHDAEVPNWLQPMARKESEIRLSEASCIEGNFMVCPSDKPEQYAYRISFRSKEGKIKHLCVLPKKTANGLAFEIKNMEGKMYSSIGDLIYDLCHRGFLTQPYGVPVDEEEFDDLTDNDRVVIPLAPKWGNAAVQSAPTAPANPVNSFQTALATTGPPGKTGVLSKTGVMSKTGTPAKTGTSGVPRGAEYNTQTPFAADPREAASEYPSTPAFPTAPVDDFDGVFLVRKKDNGYVISLVQSGTFVHHNVTQIPLTGRFEINQRPFKAPVKTIVGVVQYLSQQLDATRVLLKIGVPPHPGKEVNTTNIAQPLRNPGEEIYGDPINNMGSWLHGDIPRKEAEDLLSAFMVKETERRWAKLQPPVTASSAVALPYAKWQPGSDHPGFGPQAIVQAHGAGGGMEWSPSGNSSMYPDLSPMMQAGVGRPGKKRYNLFLSHDWGTDQQNHHKVGRLYLELQKLGVTAWFDEVNLKGEMVNGLLEGMKICDYFVMFVTKAYHDKAIGKITMPGRVNGVKIEVDTAIKSFLPNEKIITVVTEVSMKNEAKWEGKLEMLSGYKYIDYCNDARLARAAKEIEKMVTGGQGMASLEASSDSLMASVKKFMGADLDEPGNGPAEETEPSPQQKKGNLLDRSTGKYSQKRQTDPPARLPKIQVPETVKGIIPPGKTVALIVGETGAGKSSLINAMTCYFRGGTFDKPKIAIPTAFHPITEDDFKHLGSEAGVTDLQKAQTQNATPYKFKDGFGNSFTLVDTPGLGDTEGLEKDEANIDVIIKGAEAQEDINALIFVLNGSVARLTSNIKWVFTKLKGTIPDNVLTNSIVVFTRVVNEKANLFKDVRSVFGFDPVAKFYMDNSTFSLNPNTPDEDEDDYKLHTISFKKCMTNVKSITEKIASMKQVGVKEFKQMRELRFIIKQSLHKAQTEMFELQKLQEQLELQQLQADRHKQGMQQHANFKQQKKVKKTEFIEADVHSTICQACTHMCHKGCGLSEIAEKGSNAFKNCAAFCNDDYCRECPDHCKYTEHYHRKVDILQYDVTVEEELEDMKQKFLRAQNDALQADHDLSTLQGQRDMIKAMGKQIVDQLQKDCLQLKKICKGFNLAAEVSETIKRMKMEAGELQDTHASNAAKDMIRSMELIVNSCRS